jgi:hypothetical protein
MPTPTAAQHFYSHPAARPFICQDLLDGRVIKLNPALITITGGLVSTTDPLVLQQLVSAHVQGLLAHSKAATIQLNEVLDHLPRLNCSYAIWFVCDTGPRGRLVRSRCSARR